MKSRSRSLIFGLILVASPLAYAQDEAAVGALDADTPTTTLRGNRFIAPANWRLSVRGPATFIEAPEGGSRIVLVDVDANDGDAALAAGWAAYRDIDLKLKVTNGQPIAECARQSWQRIRR